ncbi:AsmA family protein [Caenispirillum salinarum]|uniref:AsmA family protein n=1 Tax=Caenispirillum salinarum TaxID=859058 RepID=UPI00384D4FBA
MKKALIGIAVLLVLLIAGVLVAPSVIDWNRYKDRITAWVEQETGRDLDIAGDLSLSLLPTPTLSASGVTFANALAGGDEPMVRVDDLDVRVAFGPLLAGEVRVESVRLVRPRVVLEVLPDGSGNWRVSGRVSGAEGEPASGAVPGPDGAPVTDQAEAVADDFQVALDSLVVEDGAVLWRDAAGVELRIEDIDGRVAAESLRGPFAGDLEATLRGARLAATVRTGRFGPQDPATSLFLTLGLPETGGEMEMQGRIAGLADGEGPSFTGDMTVASPSLSRTLAALNGVPDRAPLDRPFRLTGALTASPTQVALDDMTLRLGETEGTGGVSASLAGAPSIDVALAFTRIDMDALLKEARLAPPPSRAPASRQAGAIIPAAATAGDTAPVVPVPAAGGERGLLPDLPPDLTGSVDVGADVITWRGGLVRSARINATLADGEVTFNQVQALLPGSSEVNGFGFLNTRADPARLDGTAEVKSSNLRALLEWLGVTVGDVPADRLRRFTATAAVTGTAAQIVVENLQGQLDLTTYQGAAAVRTTGARPAFGLSLSVDSLNLDAYLADPGAAMPGPSEPSEPARPAAPAAEPTPQGETAEPGAPPLFAGLGVLNTFDANIKARAGMLTWRDTEVRDARLDVTLLEGTATFGDTVLSQIAGATVSVGGGLSGFGGEPRFDGLSIAVAADDPGRISRLLDMTLPVDPDQLAPVALSATLNGSLDALSLRSSNQFAGGSLSAEGTLRNVRGASPAYDLSLTADHGSVVTLLRRLGVTYEPRGGTGLGPLSLTTRATGSADGVRLEDMTLRLGPTTLTGRATVETGGERPRVSATLDADHVPLDAFLPAERTAWRGPAQRQAGVVPASMRVGPAPRGNGPTAAPAQVDGAPRWSREPLDLDVLDAADVDLALTAGALSHEDWVLSGAELSAVLAGGRLEVPSLTGSLFGGPLTLGGSLARAGDGGAAAALSATLSGMDVGAALTALAGQRSARGRMDVSVDVAATGESAFALVSSLDGSGRLALRKVDMRRVEGDPKGSALAAILAPLRLLDRLGGGLGGESYGVDVTGDFMVEDGVVRFAEDDPVGLESNLYDGTLAGTVALPPWTLDVQGRVQLAQNAVTQLLGGAVSLPDVIPVRVSGPLDDPDVIIGTRRQAQDGDGAAPAEKPEARARDAVRQLLQEEVGGAQKEQAPEQKPEKVLRDALKDMLFR